MKKEMKLPKPVETYVRAINARDADAFQSSFAHDAVVYYRYRSGLWETARQAYGIGVNCEQILRDFAVLRDGTHHGDRRTAVDEADDGDGSALVRAIGRAAWLGSHLPYLAGSRRHRGLWISVAAQYLGRLNGAGRFRLLDRRRAR